MVIKNYKTSASQRAATARWYAKNKERAKAAMNRWTAANPEKAALVRRRVHLKHFYNLTIEQFDEILLRQGGKCLICKGVEKVKKYLCVDHDHKTGAVRALLCTACNAGVGNFKESVELLKAACSYLESFATVGS